MPTCSLCLAAFSASFNATWLTLREPHQPRPRAQGIIRTSPHLFLLSTVSEEYFRQLVFSSSHPFHNIGNYFNALTTTKLFFGSISSFDLVLHISDSSAHTEYLGTTQAGIGIKYSPIIFRPDYSVQYQSTHIPRLPNISIVCEGLTTTPPKQSKARFGAIAKKLKFFGIANTIPNTISSPHLITSAPLVLSAWEICGDFAIQAARYRSTRICQE